MANLEKYSLNFKTLLDAIRLRNHVIEMFERADREPDPLARKSLLSLVVAGGGFAGVEVAGALNDFSRGILADYPNLQQEDLSVTLVHSRERILPELSESLAHYALTKMHARGVTFRLNTRLTDAQPVGDSVLVLRTWERGMRTFIHAPFCEPDIARIEFSTWGSGCTAEAYIKARPPQRTTPIHIRFCRPDVPIPDLCALPQTCPEQ
jgi:Pyridine nucleotide-disulphide oxidoreductase